MRARPSILRCVLVALASIASLWSALASAAGPRVALDTTMGRIVVELDLDHAPATSRNFMRYVGEGHYDGTLFHRVVEDFVIQGGGLGPDLDERKTHEPVVNEAANGLSNLTGTIAMAREDAPDSATSQFFINVADNVRLDHVDVPPEGTTVMRRGQPMHVMPADASRVFGYAVFGHVVEGQDVVERIRHVPVHTVEHGETFENVPVDPVVLRKATLLNP